MGPGGNDSLGRTIEISMSNPAKRLAILLTVATLAGGAWYYLRQSRVSGPALAVVPARWTFLNPEGLDAADEAVAEAITSAVASRGKIPDRKSTRLNSSH